MAEYSAKPTVNDIARVAGVSLATVDRVINERPGVRSATIERVNSAIQKLGYVRDTAAANLARSRTYNFLFILPASDNEFIMSLEAQIAERTAKEDIPGTGARGVDSEPWPESERSRASTRARPTRPPMHRSPNPLGAFARFR